MEICSTIKSRQMVTAAGFPDSLKFHQQELITPDVDIQGQYVKLFTQLLHLQNIFFAERLLLRHGSPDEGDLLVTSFTMVSLVLNFWIHKDRFSDIHMQRNFPWMVSWSYNFPSEIKDLLYIGSSIWRPRWWYSLHGAASSYFYGLPPKRRQPQSLTNRTATQPSR